MVWSTCCAHLEEKVGIEPTSSVPSCYKVKSLPLVYFWTASRSLSMWTNRKWLTGSALSLTLSNFAYTNVGHDPSCLCLLFVDLTDAFTTVWREPRGKHFGQLPKEDAADEISTHTPWIVEWFAAYHNSVLGITGAPPELVDLLRTSHSTTWLRVLIVHGCSKLRTTLGLKQGCVLASWLFGVFLDAAKRSIKADLERAGLRQTIPAVSLHSFPYAVADAALATTSLDWVDDMVSPRWAADPVQALRESKAAFGCHARSH
eukprot:1341742-Amphidinium_carterae.1